MQGPVHPHVRIFAAWIRKWGKLQLALFCQLVLLILAALFSICLELVLHNQIDFTLLNGALLFTLALGPVFISFIFYLVLHLDAALSYLIDSAHQERLLNEGMQDNIRQLNFEIEERKKPFRLSAGRLMSCAKKLPNVKKPR